MIPVTNPRLILLMTYLVAGFAMIAASIPLIRGRIAPNAWYGFRVPRTLNNPDVWYPVNRYAAYHMMGLGIAVALAASALYFIPGVDFISYALICLGVTLGGLAGAMIRSFRYLSRI